MFHTLPAIILLALLSAPVFAAGQTLQRYGVPSLDDPSTRAIWQLDFTGPSSVARTILADDGFVFEEDMAADGAIELLSEKGCLLLRTSKPAFGLVAKRDLPPGKTNWLVIEWGVGRFPETANWQRGVRREAIMIYLFFGQPQPADRFFLPQSPYFIGHFLGQHEPPRQPFIGNSYRQTGRYVCLATPEPGQLVSTAFNFADAFHRWFDSETVPPVTGIAIAMDTSGLADGSSSAFIKRIALVHNPEKG
jgi:hypothetical protein